MEIQELERREMVAHKLLFKCTFAHFQDIDLHPGQMHFIMVLLNLGRCTQTELAKKLHVSNASVGISVRRLMKAGFVKKSTDQNDLRATNIELTESGRKFAVEAKQKTEEITRVKFSGLTKKQLEEYGNILGVIDSNLRKYYANLKGHEA
jgi:Transcriptional regulators